MLIVDVVGDTVVVAVLSISVVPTVSVKDAEIIDGELVELPLVVDEVMDEVRVSVSSGCCVEPVGVANPLHVLGI